MARQGEVEVSDAQWEEIRARYRTGVSIAQLSRDTGVPRSVIGHRKRKEKWLVDQQKEKNDRVWEELAKRNGVTGQAVEVSESEGVAEGQACTRTLPHNGPLVPGSERPTQDLDPLDKEVARQLALIQDHQAQVGKARGIAQQLLVKLEDVLVRGEAADFLRVRTPQGVEFRLPFLGPKESLSDALNKVSTTLQKLVTLERQAHGLLDKETEEKSGALVNVYFGDFRAGQQDASERTEQAGRTVEGIAYDIRRSTEHL